ncbi:hypothetical protein, partial [Escherichia coli]|uniref:hypothetical protein n=1 Tax=Escherichia coli TaxID=562 RepID=UPI002899DC37
SKQVISASKETVAQTYKYDPLKYIIDILTAELIKKAIFCDKTVYFDFIFDSNQYLKISLLLSNTEGNITKTANNTPQSFGRSTYIVI